MTKLLIPSSLAALVAAALALHAPSSNAPSTTSATTPAPARPPPPRGHVISSASCDGEPLAPADWKSETVYLFGQRVKSSGRIYQMVGRAKPTRGKSGTRAPTGNGTVIRDGDLEWAYAMDAPGGRIFYVCDCPPGSDERCKEGDDDRSSKQAQNPESPWRSLAKARREFASMAAGDTIALCRGGIFVQMDDDPWYNIKCRANNNCTLRDYTPPWGTSRTLELPRIESGPNRSRGLPFMQGGGGYRVLNLHLRSKGSVVWGYGLSSNLSDLTICNNTIEGYGIGLQDDCGEHNPTTARTVIIGSRFLKNRGMGVLAGGPGNVIADNLFDGNGHQPVYDHSIYLSNHAEAPAQTLVFGNEILRNTFTDGLCRAPAITAHGRFQNLVVEENLIHHPGTAGGACWGIDLGAGGYPKHPEFMKNVTVRSNRIYGTGSVGIGVDICSNCVIENNLVVVDGNGSGGVEGIKAPTRTYDKAGAIHSSSITVRHNSVYFTSTAAEGNFTGISSVADGAEHVVANNAFAWYGGKKANFVCLNLHAKYRAVSRNACFGGTVGYSGKGTITSAPRFEKPGMDPTHDFIPGASSPLVGAGDPEHTLPMDLSGLPRRDKPSIGAYER